MHKTITTALLILASGLTFSATALAEPFNHGGSYTNAISNVYPDTGTQSVQSAQFLETGPMIGGFNMRSAVENEDFTANSRTDVNTSISGMYTAVGQFNDRS